MVPGKDEIPTQPEVKNAEFSSGNSLIVDNSSSEAHR